MSKALGSTPNHKNRNKNKSKASRQMSHGVSPPPQSRIWELRLILRHRRACGRYLDGRDSGQTEGPSVEGRAGAVEEAEKAACGSAGHVP